MNQFSRLPRWGIAAIAFVVAAGALWLLVVGFEDAVRLADGRKVTVVAVTCGTNHVFVDGPIHARLARKFVSRARAFELGLRIYEQSSRSPSIMVWTRWHLPSSNLAPRFALVRDRNGIESEPIYVAIDAPYREEKRAIMGWRFENYPRRDEKFTFCFYERNPAYQPSYVGEITVRNEMNSRAEADPAPYAPVTATRNGVEFSLVSLRCGEPPPPGLSNRYNFIAPATTAWFEMRSDGRIDTNWMIRSVEVFGVTSNRFSLPQPTISETNGRLSLAFSEVMWPDEPSWKMTVEFARIRDFGTNGLVTFGPFPAVRLGQSTSTNLKGEAHGIKFETLGIRPTTWYMPFRRSPYLRTTDVTLAYVSPESTLRVDLARVEDDLGRELRFGNGADQYRGRYLAGLELLTNTTSIQLTFAVQRSEIVEFVVRPVFAAGWKRVESR